MKTEFVKTRSMFEKLKEDRAASWFVRQPDDVQNAINWILSVTEFKTENVTGYFSDGYYLNIFCRCNVFYEDSTVFSILLSDLKDPEAVADQIEKHGGHLFSDVIVEFSP